MSLDKTNAGAVSDDTQEVDHAGGQGGGLQEEPPQPATASGRSKASHKRYDGAHFTDTSVASSDFASTC